MIDQAVLSFGQLIFIGPLLVITATVLVLVLVDVFARLAGTRGGLGLIGSTIISLIGTALAAVHGLYLWWQLDAGASQVLAQLFVAKGPPQGRDTTVPLWAGGALVVDHFALFVTVAVCVVVILVCLNLLPHLQRRQLYRPELFPLLLLSAVGMILLGMSRDLLVTFISIELVSLPLYVLCGLDARRDTSRESSLKYFLLGAFASGFLIYGAALAYGVTGHLNYQAFNHYLKYATEISGIFLLGIALVGVGFAFKLALVPFHAWVPDVYQGAPTPVTAFMAAGVKLGVFAAAVRFVVESLGLLAPQFWRDGLVLFAILSMVVGNLFALHQMSAKRLLAYSAITHTGYLAVALCAGTGFAARGVLVYLVGYGLAALGAFMLISYLAPGEQDDIYLDEMHELSRRAPLTSLALAILLFSMAGFPLTLGFIGKLVVFTDAWRAGLHALVIIALLNSVVSVYYYLRFVLAMYMQPRAPGAAKLILHRMPGAYAIAGIFTVGLTLLLGVLPGILLTWVHNCTLGY